MNWEQYIWAIIASAIIIPLVSLAMKRIIHWLKTDKIEIFIKVPEELLDTKTKFGLLHVRDGKDEVSDRGKLLNKINWFKKVDELGNLKTSVRYTKNLGFQFKCFVDYREIDFDRLKEVLEKNGYLCVTKGEGKDKRIWFMHPNYPTCKTVDKIENNFFYPE